MRTKHIIFDLLNYLDEYEKGRQDRDEILSTADFIGFINSVHQPDTINDDKIRGGKDAWKATQDTENKIATNVSILVTLLFRYAKMYTRKALKDSGVKTVEEFAILITLLTHDSISKQELIREQVLEKTSGIEIVNRMIRQGYIQQFAGAKDRRSKLLRITEEGTSELMQILPKMNMVSKIVVGNLTTTEQNQLIYLMRKLDHFHNEIFLNEKDAELEDILNKTNPSG